MNDQTPNAADANELQFNEAEYAAPSLGEPTCVACGQAIPDHYFQVNGVVLCEPCSTTVRSQLTGGASLPRFFRAGLYGFGAAVAGFAIYFGVLKLTGWEIGLISILVGYMVGMAVNKGSAGRGGALYQLMAVGFTYLAISVSYSALVIPEMIDKLKADKAAAAQPGNAKNVGAKEAAHDEPAGEAVRQKTLTPFDVFVGIVSLFALMLALPVIVGFSQPIGLLIVAFALWEAYKLNRKASFVITGPHNVGRAPERAPAHA